MLAARPVRRSHPVPTAAARPGPQAHRRGRHRAEHRRHGRLCPGPGPARRPRSSRPRSSASARPPSRRRHALRRCAVRRADADHGRASDWSSTTSASAIPRPRQCCHSSTRTSQRWRWRRPPVTLAGSRVRIRPGAAVTVVAASASTRLGSTGDVITDDAGAERPGGVAAATPISIRFDAAVKLDPDGTQRTSGGRVLAVTGLGDDLALELGNAYHTTGADPAPRGCRYAGTSAGEPRAPGFVRRRRSRHRRGHPSGRRDPRPVESTHDGASGRGVLQGVGSFGGVFSAAALTELDEPVLVASTDGVGTKVESPARLGRRSKGSATTSSTTASTTSSCRAPDRCSSSTTSPPAPSTPSWSPRSSRAWPRPAGRPAAPCSAARPPRCPASTARGVRHRRHHRRRRRATALLAAGRPWPPATC